MSEFEESFERTLRQSMIFQSNFVWRVVFEKRISLLLEKLSEKLQESDAKSRLQRSHRLFKGIVETLVYNEEYSKEEDPDTFEGLLVKLEQAFKCVFESYMIEDHVFTSEDKKVDYLNKQFYDSLARKRQLPPNRYVYQAYPPVTLLIRLLENCQRHGRDPPTDPITRKKSFGNVYTLSSAIILSVYAYMEILQAWLETIKIVNSRRSNDS